MHQKAKYVTMSVLIYYASNAKWVCNWAVLIFGKKVQMSELIYYSILKMKHILSET